MASEPTVVRAVRAQRDALLARDAKQMQAMAKVWETVESELQASMDALALQIDAMRQAGETVNPGKVYRMERFQRLLFEVRKETERFADDVAHTVEAGQREVSWLAQEEATHVLRLGGADAGAALVQLNPAVVEGMVGIMGDGTPLRQYLSGVYGDAARGMSDYLTRAVAQGLNPRQTARQMAKGLQIGLDRALVISRTEQLRVYRETQRLGYEQSGVVQGYWRISAKNSRTCLGCLVADGRFYSLTESFEDHPQGRCALVPALPGQTEPGWETGQTWLENQPEATQRKIMGPGRHELWQSGQVSLKDMAQHNTDPLWGGSWTPKSLKDLMQSERKAAVGGTRQLAQTTEKPKSARELRREGIARVEAQLKARREAQKAAAKAPKQGVAEVPGATAAKRSVSIAADIDRAKTPEAVQKLLQQQFPGTKFDIAGLDLETAKDMAHGVNTVATKLRPEDAQAIMGQWKELRLVKLADPREKMTRAMAESLEGRARITLNTPRWSNRKKMMESMVREAESGYAPAGTTDPARIISHELAHVYEDGGGAPQSTLNLLKAWQEQHYRRSFLVSEYATTDASELFAESFSQMLHAPRELWPQATQDLAQIFGVVP